MRIFLDTSILSEARLKLVGEEVTARRGAGDEFLVSAITHFQLVWGYLLAQLTSARYEAFLKAFEIQIVPLTKKDAETAAKFKPGRADLLDAMIAASANRYGATVWTNDKDFLKFLPQQGLRIF